MRRLFCLVALSLLAPVTAEAAAATVAAIPGTARGISITCASGTCDAPSGTPTAATAMQLDSPRAVEVWIAADSGQTLTAGTVTLLAYRYDSMIGRWAEAPGLNVTVTAKGGGRDLCYEGYTVNTSRGFLLLIPSAVAVSSGGVTILMLASGDKSHAETL